MMNWLITEPAAWTERYETLRRYVLEGRALLESQPLGLVLWMAKGTAGGMSEWSKLSQPESPAPPMACQPRCPGTGQWQEELTMLLAQMTLPHLHHPVAYHDS
jgi:hypothetical protein